MASMCPEWTEEGQCGYACAKDGATPITSCAGLTRECPIRTAPQDYVTITSLGASEERVAPVHLGRTEVTFGERVRIAEKFGLPLSSI